MLQQSKPLESILMLRELARLEPENVAYPAEMARLYGELDRVDDAQRTLQEFAESAPANAAAPRALAEFFLSAKNEPVLAVQHAQKAAELSGTASDWVLLSAAHERAGNLPAAIAALERASGLAPDNLQYRQLLALLKQRAAAQNTKEAAPPRKPDPPRSDLGASPAAKTPDSR
jgi:tetratricopeptide (TPR) repeat protein